MPSSTSKTSTLRNPSNPPMILPRLAAFAHYLLGSPEMRLALAGLTLLLAGLALPQSLSLAGRALQILGVALAALPVARSGLTNLFKHRAVTIPLLMTIAAGGAVIIGDLTEAAALVILFILSEGLESYTTEQARRGLHDLGPLLPTTATRLHPGLEETVPLEELRPGDAVLVRPGEYILVDAVVSRGTSAVNQSSLTGESLPVEKSPGDEVFAGTINGSGMLELNVTRPVQESALSRMERLVEAAHTRRAPIQRLVDRFAAWYTPAMVALAVLVAALPPLLLGAPFLPAAGDRGWLYRSLALLVISCPCALVLGVSISSISALTAASRRGVLIKGGAFLEALSLVKVVAFDKTGTLTRGQPVVTASRSSLCASGDPCDDCDRVLALASSLESRSTHPLARAVVSAAEAQGLAGMFAPADAVQVLAGRGITGQVDGQMTILGSHALFSGSHPHPEPLCGWVETAEAAGQTTMLIGNQDGPFGYIAVADELRPETPAAVAALHALGLQTAILTGDNPAAAAAVARQTGIDVVESGLLPGDKQEAVHRLSERWGAVAMVGDGVNDTPALALASVGIAMGGAGSAQAMETADVVLMGSGLTRLPFAVRLSRLARRLITQNIAFALGVKLLVLLLTLAGLSTLWMAVAADMGVTLAVALNGLRPLWMRDLHPAG